MVLERLTVLGLKYTHKSKKALTNPPELFTDRESAIQYSNGTIILQKILYTREKQC
jgi:hypothetical protein